MPRHGEELPIVVETASRVVVLVKSSRRPWCLERTLRSLRMNITDYEEVQVVVADDRTLLEHREKISGLFPEITWQINSSAEPQKTFIDNWTTAIALSGASHVLVVEDDQILCEKISVLKLASEMLEIGCRLLNINLPSALVGSDFTRRYWKDFDFYLPPALAVQERIRHISSLIRFFSAPGFWGWKFRALAVTLFPKSTNKLQGDLTLLNGICGVIYETAFWEEVWGPTQSSIDEWVQANRILKAIMSTKHSGPGIVARNREPAFKTTYSSSISPRRGWELDWEQINAVWSNEWLENRLIFPDQCEDWSPSYLAQILSKNLGSEVGRTYYSWARYFHLRHTGLDIGEPGVELR